MSETGDKNLDYLKELFGEIIGKDASWNRWRWIIKNNCTRGGNTLIKQENGNKYFLNGDIAGSPFLGKTSIALGEKEDGSVCLAELDGYKIDTELSDIVALCMREESRKVRDLTTMPGGLIIKLRRQEAGTKTELKKHLRQTPNNYPILLSLTNLALLRVEKDDEFQGIIDKISNLGKEDIEYIIELLKDSYSLREIGEQRDNAVTRYDPGVCLDGIARFIVEKKEVKKGEFKKDFEEWADKLPTTKEESVALELMGVIRENKGKIRIKEQSESVKQIVNPSFKSISDVEQSGVDAQQPVALEPSTDSSVINVSNREQTLNTTLLEKMTALETRIEEQNKLIKEQGELIKNLLSVLKLNKDMVVSNISSAADDLEKFAQDNKEKELGA